MVQKVMADVIPYLDQQPYDVAAARTQARAMERELRRLEKTASPDDPAVLAALERAAIAYEHAQQGAKALDAWQRLLRLREQTLPPNAGPILEALEKVGLWLQGVHGQHTRARPYLARVLAMQEAALGGDDPSLANLVLQLGIAHGAGSPRDFAEAERLYRRSLTLFERAHGPEHWKVFRPLEMLADLLYTQHREEEAAALFERGMTLATTLYDFASSHAHADWSDGLPEGFGWALAFVSAYCRTLHPSGSARQALEQRLTAIHRARSPAEQHREWTRPLAV